VYKQSRRRSATEAIMNVIIGYMVAVFANLIVLPLFGYNVTLSDGAAIGLAFTIISLIRSYVIRRVFNYYD
jgi:acetyltransferase-like isoleucine patch superfamily enzyme